MSDALSSAPEPGGGGQSPTAATLPSAGQPAAKGPEKIGGAGAVEEPKPKEPKQIKPITRLPGVITRGGDDLPELTKNRDASGRFLPKDGAKEAEGDEELSPIEREMREERAREKGEAPAKPGADGKPPLPAGAKPAADGAEKPIEFGGRRYKTHDEALQAARSLHGMFKPMQTELTRTKEEKEYGYKAANAWMEKAQALEAELNAVRGGKPAPQAGRAGAGASAAAATGAGEGDELPSLETLINGIDTDAFEAIATHKDGGLPQAAKYLVGEILRVVNEQVLPARDKRWEKALTPFQEAQITAQRGKEADQLVEQVASLKLGNGQDAFPELKDTGKLVEIGDAWARSGLPPEAILTPQGLISAVGLYRTLQTFHPTEAAPNGNPAPSGDAEEEAQILNPPASGAAASVGAEPSGVMPPNAGRSNLSPASQRLLNALDKTNLVDRSLGFAVRRREARA